MERDRQADRCGCSSKTGAAPVRLGEEELSRKAKLSIYWLVYVSTLNYGHELWAVTKRTRSPIQAAKMSFLRRVARLSLRERVRGWVSSVGLSLRDRVPSSDIRREFGVEPLLLRIERSQLWWFGHLIRTPPERLSLEVYEVRPTGRRPRGRPRTRWRDYISLLAYEHLRILQKELENVAGERKVWVSLLGLLPPRPKPRLCGWEWMDGNKNKKKAL